ncbi:MAG TPA: M20/M25/M40 family metallo-hydrolase [Bryobacteraceae bacterium]|nr:M20/M25/M40 family metallo-hydrolase [Bryobacteraceae bacterium]
MRLCVCAIVAAVSALAQDTVDLGVVSRIKSEAFERSKVMDHLYNLTEVRGPRLTGSPEFDQAASWTVDRLKEYGLRNVHLEHWGPFGRSWSIKESSVELIEPRYGQLIAAPLAWSSSTKGPVTGDLIIAPLKASFRDGPAKLKEEMAAYRSKWAGKLRGKILLLSEPKIPKPQTSPLFRRLTEAQLRDLATAPDPAVAPLAKKLEDLKWPEDPEDIGKFLGGLPNSLMEQLYDLYDAAAAERGAFFAKEGAVGVLMEDARAHDGLDFAEAAGGFKASDPAAPPTFVITAEQYDRIARAVGKQIPTRVRLNLKVDVSEKDVDGANIIGEIPGGSRKDEVVMIGAHFDSWHTGTGATDNGAGSAVMIEVMRILETLHLRLDRTVRIALWSGEEQGLLGSRAYVKEHFGDPATMHLTAEHARLTGYFNLDNGSGKVRGVYLQGNDAMRPIFESWLTPFRDLGVTTVSIRNTGGTDHLSFDGVGLPGFQFIQDPLDYSTVTHHSNMDTFDHAVPEDLMQASAVIATVVYEAANRKDLLPRREEPKP